MRLLISAAIAVAGLASFAVQAAEWATDFTAEMVMTNPDNPSQQKTATFYSSKGRTRTESAIPARRAKKQGMGRQQVDIVNPYLGAMWRVFPDVQKYMERSGKPQTSVPAPSLPGDADHPCSKVEEVSCKNLGVEVIGGRETEKWEITSTGEQGAVTTTLWFDVELGVPMRELVPGKLMREMRNVKTGSLDDGLFQAPSGYQKVTPPSR